MQKLTRNDLYSLEAYAEARPQFRAKVLAHKKNRKLPLGPHATLYFEDRLTIQYQIQEMLRVERIFEGAAIQEELDTYNPLIPDGHDLKATFMLEYDDPEDRQPALARLRGIEDNVWLQVEGCARVWPIADEDLERENDEKTSAVHFLRFDLKPDMVSALKGGASLSFGIDHEHYCYELAPAPEETRAALVADLDEWS
jgi:hypothetical protein